MTPSHPPSFAFTAEAEGGTVLVRVTGDLDLDTCDELLKTVERCLDDRRERPEGPHDLHLDFSGLDTVDSMGLSTLLTIRRCTDRAGVRLHLDARPLGLERLLDITGTLHHLTAPRAESSGEQRPGTG